MQAIIMAGGKGTRLAPYTAVLPKPLMPIGDIPILELLLLQLKSYGITEIVLAVNHLSHIIKAFFEDGSRLGINISYTYENKALGTAGPLGAVIDKMSDNFLLLNGDLLTTLNFRSIFEAHIAYKADATIATYERELKSDFGVLEMNQANELTGYFEKPSFKQKVSMGMYVINKHGVYNYVQANEYLDMPAFMLKLVSAHKKVVCHLVNDFWLDIGRPDDYALAQDLFAKDKTFFLHE